MENNYLVKIEFPEINFICFVDKDYVVFHVEPYNEHMILKDIRKIYKNYKDEAIFTKKILIDNLTGEEKIKKMSSKNPQFIHLIEEFELTL